MPYFLRIGFKNIANRGKVKAKTNIAVVINDKVIDSCRALEMINGVWVEIIFFVEIIGNGGNLRLTGPKGIVFWFLIIIV